MATEDHYSVNSSDIFYDSGFPEAKIVPREVSVALFVSFFIFIVCGNIWVLLAVIRQPKLRKSSTCMFIISLSISDLMMAIFFIPTQLAYVAFNLTMTNVVLCKGSGWLHWVAQCATIFSLLGIGIDRYRAIVQPLRPRLNRKDALTCISIIWTCAMTYSYYRLHILDIVTRTYPVGVNTTVSITMCSISMEKHDVLQYMQISDFLVMYLVPLLILCVMYFIMISSLWFSASPNNASKNKKRKAVKMLSFVVVLFGITWFPWRFFSLYFDFADPDLIPISMYVWSDVIAATCIASYLANSWVNPIVYAYFNENFRKEFYCCFHVSNGRINPELGQIREQ
ncbi:neuropeptide FF receptor 2-like [Saccoglossus kowalevskii]|uniref:Neuropeptide FF receptor 2-like n=1 Tax=Saccoglossus kowalevskii TaxID=10224 RepID=A0ABM0GVV5_SACKO|nr:PREDICTED: neuropeptide FF receptor 2-like [Saccoglossus kowalevskii]